MVRSITVKIGGAQGVNAQLVCADIAAAIRNGWQVTVVHGGSHDVDRLTAAAGRPPRALTSVSGYQSRYTDAATMDLVLAAIAGTVNKRLVQQLVQAGVRAFGLSGVDGALIRACRRPALKIREEGRVRIIHDDLSGRIERVDVELLRWILDAGRVPVIAPPALSAEGEILNVDADRAAAAVAVALGSEALIMLSNVPGILADPSDAGSVVRAITTDEIGDYLARVGGRMKTKLAAARIALEGGVSSVIIGDSRVDRPVRSALGRAQGTWLGRASAA